jgi:hypothetical protein
LVLARVSRIGLMTSVMVRAFDVSIPGIGPAVSARSAEPIPLRPREPIRIQPQMTQIFTDVAAFGCRPAQRTHLCHL